MMLAFSWWLLKYFVKNFLNRMDSHKDLNYRQFTNLDFFAHFIKINLFSSLDAADEYLKEITCF